MAKEAMTLGHYFCLFRLSFVFTVGDVLGYKISGCMASLGNHTGQQSSTTSQVRFGNLSGPRTIQL